MKCNVCDFDDTNLADKDKFIEIEGHFTTLIDRSKWEPLHRIEIVIFACPTCGTLKMNLNQLHWF